MARARRADPAPVGLPALLLGTALLYLVGLSVSGWANEFYAAAVQAGTTSWKAFWFGSLDGSNFITVDKPPASLWVMELSARAFGVSSWSVLVPQALEGVAAVAVLYAAVARVAGTGAGLLAGLVLATTPVAALMFRFDNPDALLVLLMTAAAYATVRAVQGARTRWLVLAGALLGLAFLTKMLQGFLVVPGFAGAYLLAAPTSWWRRARDLAAGAAALVVAAGWWVALVQLWPAGSRPYVGGTTGNSVLELTFGYNGLGRLDGGSNNGAVNGGTGGFSAGSTGLGRLFGDEMGGQVAWLLPAALLALGVLAGRTRRAPRTDALRASLVVWGGWTVVTGLVLSLAGGIIHAYYTVALAPGIAALVGLGAAVLWRDRAAPAARAVLAAGVALSAGWSCVLLARGTSEGWVRWVVLPAAAGAVALLLGSTALRRAGAVAALTVALGLVAGVAGPTAWALRTAATAHTGALPTAGPATTGAGPGGGLGRGPGGGPGPAAGGRPAGAGGGTAGAPGPASPGRAGGFGGGLGGAVTVGSALTAALSGDASTYTWVAAVTGDNEAASLQLATGHPVMALGGYNGTDPAIDLAAFQRLVAARAVHWYVVSDGFIGSTSAQGSTAYAIEQWVAATFTASTVDGTTVYDLTAG